MSGTRVDWFALARWSAMGSAAAAMVSVAVSQILLGVAVAALLLSRQRWRLPPGVVWLALFVTWTLASLLVNGDPRGGLPQIRKFYVWLLLFVLATAMRGAEDFRRLILAWSALASVAALRGLWQFWMKWQAAAAASQDFYQSYVGARITGFMSHWMTFSSQMLVGLLSGAALLLFSPLERRLKLWLAGGLGVIATGLLLGFTRGIWVAAGAGSLYLVWNWRRWAVLALPIAGLIALAAGPASVRARFTSLFQPRGQTDSNQHRVVTWRTGLRMIEAHPVFGVGPEQVGRRFDSFVPPDVAKPLPEGWYGHLHNFYLQYAAERGIPAAGFLVLFLLAQVAFWRARHRAGLLPGWAFHAAIAVLLGILVTGLFEHNLGDSEVLALTLGALGGAAAAGRES